MKINTICIVVLVLFFAACSNNDKKEKKEKVRSDQPVMVNVDEPVKDTVQAKNVTDRDYSITAENAYNDIFLDSLAMEKYITDHKLADKKIGLRIRSFYNARNYQYAWFSPGGFTEQTRFFWNQYDYAVTHLKATTLANSDFYKRAEKLVNQEEITFNKQDPNFLYAEFAFTE